MESAGALDYAHAHAYAMAWMALDHDDATRFHADGKGLFGTLGTLEFQFLPEEAVLHVWVFIMPGADPTTERGQILKGMLDRIASEHPEETSGGLFDIRTLPWNKQASARLEPCLWLRLDLRDGSQSLEQVVPRLKEFSRTGYIWHREKIQRVLAAYWRDHPRSGR